jgi:hypothetical protein
MLTSAVLRFARICALTPWRHVAQLIVPTLITEPTRYVLLLMAGELARRARHSTNRRVGFEFLFAGQELDLFLQSFRFKNVGG